MKKQISFFVLLLMLILEGFGFYFSIQSRGKEVVYYYTQISNLITVISAILYLVCALIHKKSNREIALFEKIVTLFRFGSSCMLLCTVFVTAVILAPIGVVSLQTLFFSPLENGFYHHLVCPILSVGSYLVLEPHLKNKMGYCFPILLTFIYGSVMIMLNVRHIVEGPYPFFYVYKQSVLVTICWFYGILFVIFGIASLLNWVSFRFFDECEQKAF